MKDWAIRAIKTFVQAFFGVLIPEVCILLNNGFPESIHAAWVVLAPVVAAALSAAICAAWNIILERLQNDPLQIYDGAEDFDEETESYKGRHTE